MLKIRVTLLAQESALLERKTSEAQWPWVIIEAVGFFPHNPTVALPSTSGASSNTGSEGTNPLHSVFLKIFFINI